MSNKDILFETDDFRLIVTYNDDGLAIDYNIQSLNEYLVGIKIDSGRVGYDDTILVYNIVIKHGLRPATMTDEFTIGFIQTLQSALAFKRLCIEYFLENDLYCIP